LIPLILATANVHKIRELKQLLKPLSSFVDLLTLKEFPDYQPPEETGESFEENAILKATHAAQALHQWALADDSGLVVPALNGAPGIFSARYAGKEASDKENRKKLLHEMEGLEGEGRNAYFECALALASPKALVKCVKASCEGTVALTEKGRHGFGYDPLFIKHDYQKSFAELEEEVKNKISHRGKAVAKILLFLENYLSREEENKE
jgi:XTP/dITP diphosphohydrolase